MPAPISPNSAPVAKRLCIVTFPCLAAQTAADTDTIIHTERTWIRLYPPKLSERLLKPKEEKATISMANTHVQPRNLCVLLPFVVASWIQPAIKA